MIEFQHAKGYYVLDVWELLHHLPPEVLKAALRRGKGVRRSRTQRVREARSQEAREIKRDELLSGSGGLRIRSGSHGSDDRGSGSYCTQQS